MHANVAVPDLIERTTVTCEGWTITVLGYCSLQPNQVLAAFHEGTLQRAEGQFVVIFCNDQQTILVNSRFGVQNYFYSMHMGDLYHGASVLEVLAASGQTWEWDWTAMGDMLHLEHALSNRTLHRSVCRLPPGSCIEFTRGQPLRVSRFDWESEEPHLPARADVALHCFNEDVKAHATATPALLMTAGFDSRVILSALLRQGIKPLLVVAGWETSTDVIVAKRIAEHFALELRIAELRAGDYVDQAGPMVSLTNGILPLSHWNSYLYCQRWKISRTETAFVGMNGEFVRTFYLDRGFATRLLDATFPGPALRYYWKMKHLHAPSNRFTFRPEELREFNPELAKELNPQKYPDRVNRCLAACHHQFLRGLDRFYLNERVAYFMGNVLRLCAPSIRWRAPFLNNRWVNVANRLGRSWKSGSNWHRYAVTQNCPELLDFPESLYGDRWDRKAPFLYWRRKPIRGYVSYADPNSWLQEGPLHDFVRSHAHDLEDLVPPAVFLRILDEHSQGTYRGRGLYYLVTLLFWKQALIRQGLA